jgi:hypothetical protein
LPEKMQKSANREELYVLGYNEAIEKTAQLNPSAIQKK